MIRLIGLWLMGCALMGVTPVAADEDVYDGPTAIKPLTVTPQPQHSAPPNAVCDYEHQCYPEKGGPVVPAPVTPPAVAVKPAAPRPPAPQNTVPDDPVVTAWRDCMGQALQNYERVHNLRALQMETQDCQVQLRVGINQSLTGLSEADPAQAQLVPPQPQSGGRRNIGCGWWPIGSDADRDCAAGGRRF